MVILRGDISMKNKFIFLTSWLIGSLLLYFATLSYPNSFVLGSAKHSVLSAAVFSGFLWTLIIFISESLAKRLKLKLDNVVLNLLSDIWFPLPEYG